MAKVRLSFSERLAPRLTFLIGGVASIAASRHADASDRVAAEDAPHRRRSIARRLGEEVVRPREIATDAARFTGEDAVGSLAESGHPSTRIALDAPETRDESREPLTLIVESRLPPEIAAFDTERWSQSALPDLARDRGHARGRRRLDLLLGCRELLGGDGCRDELQRRIAEACANATVRRPEACGGGAVEPMSAARERRRRPRGTAA